MSGAILEDEVRQGYDLAPTASVSIRNTDGRILIYGSDKARLEITAMRRAFTRERLEAIRIDVSIEGDTAIIDTIYPPVAGGSRFADRSGTVDYLILLPQRCTLAQVKLAQGEMLIEGMRGAQIEAQLDRGLMHLRDCFSAMRVHLGRGRLNVRYGWWEAGAFSLSAEVAEGNLRVAVPGGAAIHFDAATVKGKIASAFSRVPAGTQRIEEHFGEESAVEFKLRTTRGDIRLERAY